MSSEGKRQFVHATCVALNGMGVLIRGAPGSGKSELALRLIDAPGYGLGQTLVRGVLVADDQTGLEPRPDGLWASPHDKLAGLIELRGQGILQLNHVAPIKLALVVDLMLAQAIERMPEADDLKTELLGVTLPRIPLDRSQPAAPALVRAALSQHVKQLPSDGRTS